MTRKVKIHFVYSGFYLKVNSMYLNVWLSSANKIFWVDAYYDRIESSNFDGSRRKLVAVNPGSHFYDVELIGDFLYMTDWNSR